MITQQTILILGANSDMATATAYKFAGHGYNIILAARNITDTLKEKSRDISIRYSVKVKTIILDALDYDSHDKFFE